MTDLQKISKWNRDISRAIAALGKDLFFPTLIEAIQGQVRFDYPQVWLFHRELPCAPGSHIGGAQNQCQTTRYKLMCA